MEKLDFLNDAVADAGNISRSLTLAGQHSTAIENLLILELTGKAIILFQGIAALINAIETTGKEK